MKVLPGGTELEPRTFLTLARVLIVTGKGGVGKTTVSAALANLAAKNGLRALIVQLATPQARLSPPDGWAPEAWQLGRLFGSTEPVAYEPSVLVSHPTGGTVSARAIRPDEALVEYLHLHGMRRLSRRLVASGAVDVVATAIPGMPDMLVLGKVKQMERIAAAGIPDTPSLIVLDAPAAGHVVSFLQSPRGLLDAAAGGPVRAQAEEVVEMLEDPQRCRVMLVTTLEETPVSETIETARLVEERAGVQLGAVLVNGRFPTLDLPERLDPEGVGELSLSAGVRPLEAEVASLSRAGLLRAARQASQTAQLARLAETLPLPRLELPFCFSSELGPRELDELTGALSSGVDSLALDVS